MLIVPCNVTDGPLEASVLKSSPGQSSPVFLPKFHKIRQLATELVATSLSKDQLQLVFDIYWFIICHERCIRWFIYGVYVLH